MTAPILVTGAAGFIGYHVARRLLAENRAVVGVDNFSPYYDVALKEARWNKLGGDGTSGLFTGLRLDLADSSAVADLFARHTFKRVIHLAAQPGVRRALTEPMPYAASNLVAFLNILEGCRHAEAEHLVYASSSSVYGLNRKIPFAEQDAADHPASLYAATKRANELMAHSHSHLFNLPATGLRFFTVYGPWGRPDMATYIFTDSIANGRQIEVANAGKVWRDFTYIDDIVEGIVRVLDQPPQPNTDLPDADWSPATSSAPHRVYNIGNDKPEELNDLVVMIEDMLGRKANRIDKPLPPGDVLQTRADISALRKAVGFAPDTPLRTGIERFVAWYKDYHKVTAS